MAADHLNGYILEVANQIKQFKTTIISQPMLKS